MIVVFFILASVLLYIYKYFILFLFIERTPRDNELSFFFTRNSYIIKHFRQLKHSAQAETTWTLIPFLIVALILCLFHL